MLVTGSLGIPRTVKEPLVGYVNSQILSSVFRLDSESGITNIKRKENFFFFFSFPDAKLESKIWP